MQCGSRATDFRGYLTPGKHMQHLDMDDHRPCERPQSNACWIQLVRKRCPSDVPVARFKHGPVHGAVHLPGEPGRCGGPSADGMGGGGAPEGLAHGALSKRLPCYTLSCSERKDGGICQSGYTHVTCHITIIGLKQDSIDQFQLDQPLRPQLSGRGVGKSRYTTHSVSRTLCSYLLVGSVLDSLPANRTKT